MRSGPHLDGSENGIPKITAVKQGFQSSDRLIEAHILIDREGDSGRIAKPNNFAGFRIIRGKRFLTQNTLDVIAVAGGSFDDSQLLIVIGRDCDIKDCHRWVSKKL